MIRSFLDLSTANISEKTAKWLENQCELHWEYRLVLIGPLGDVGWFIYADEQPDDEVLPADLIQVMKYARSQGCEYILFDRDAAAIVNLPTHDW